MTTHITALLAGVMVIAAQFVGGDATSKTGRTLIPIEPAANRLVAADEFNVRIRTPCDRPARVDMYIPARGDVQLVTAAATYRGAPLPRSPGWTGFILYINPAAVPAMASRLLSGSLKAAPDVAVGLNGDRLTARVLCAGRTDPSALARTFALRFTPNHPLGLGASLLAGLVCFAAICAAALLARRLSLSG